MRRTPTSLDCDLAGSVSSAIDGCSAAAAHPA